MQIQNQKFKKTDLGEIPEEWKIMHLEELTTKITDIDHNMPKKMDNGIPFISVGYLVNQRSRYFEIDNNDDYLEYISVNDYNHHSKKFNAVIGDLLYSRFGTIGISKIINTNEKFIASYSIVLVKPNNKIINNSYLNFVLNGDYARKQAHLMTKGSSNRNLHLADIKHLKLLIPPLKEQQKIAFILSNVDNLIQKTDQAIEQTQRLKKGLMQRLLTKGIGHTKFKKTELGEIPEGWNIKKVNEIAELIMGQSPPGDSYNFKGLGVPLLNGPTEFGIIHPIPIQYTTKSTKLCNKGDVLLCVRGSTTGRLNLSDKEYCIGRGLCAVRSKEDIADSIWLFYHFVVLQNYIYNIASGGGSTFPNINRNLIENISIPFPPLKEQQKIAFILSNVDNLIQKLKDKKKSEEYLKKGLMQQLLTGKLRVKI